MPVKRKAMDLMPLVSSAGFGAVVKWCFDEGRRLLSERKASKKFFMDVENLYATLAPGLGMTRMDRWTVIIVHNGGKKLSLTTESFISILHESYDTDLKPRKLEYQKFPLDKSFHEMFTQAYLNESVVVNVEEKTPVGLLRDAMMISNMKHNHVFFLAENKNGLYFLSYSSSEVTYDGIDEMGRSIIQMCANKARALFNKSLNK